MGACVYAKPLSFSLILRSVSPRPLDRPPQVRRRSAGVALSHSGASFAVPIAPAAFASRPRAPSAAGNADFRIGGARRDAAFDDPPRDPNSMQLARILDPSASTLLAQVRGIIIHDVDQLSNVTTFNLTTIHATIQYTKRDKNS